MDLTSVIISSDVRQLNEDVIHLQERFQFWSVGYPISGDELKRLGLK